MLPGILRAEFADCIRGRIERIVTRSKFLDELSLLSVLRVNGQRFLADPGNVEGPDGFGRRDQDVVVPAIQIEKELVKAAVVHLLAESLSKTYSKRAASSFSQTRLEQDENKEIKARAMTPTVALTTLIVHIVF